MQQKLTLLMVATLLLGTVLVINSVAWSFEKPTPIRIPEDQIVSQPFEGFEKSGTFCEIFNDFDSPANYYGGFDSGMGLAVFMNPAQCGESPYPFEITDVHLYLYEPDGDYHWPVALQVNIRDSNQGDSCSGPGNILCSEDFSVDSDTAYPYTMTLNLSNPCCVNQPFFLEIVYTEPRDPAHPHPSLLMDPETPPPDTCDNWVLHSDGQYYEWYNYWSPPPPGDAIIRATGYTNASHCDPEWYWKPDTTNAPSGMPDFAQYQDEWQAYCGPVAVANCLWWFDAVPKEMTPPELIELLAGYFQTTPGGTNVFDMQDGLTQYFIDYGFNLYEHTYEKPNFYEMEDSLKKCQDIILLLGFYQWNAQYQVYDRIGGHFVTMAGVSSGSLKVALSDPARDMAVWLGWPGRIRPPGHPLEYPPTLHNDPTYVSQDMYTSTLESPTPGNPYWGLDYPYYIYKDEAPPFLGQNFQPEQEQFRGSYISGVEIYTEVEYAVMICPGEWYWKPDTLPQAPSGMPDFDQNQDEWVSYCGPVAVANCLWWFDAVPEGWTPPQLIDTLARYFHTDPINGTFVDSMQLGLDQYFSDYGFSLQESTFWMPDFHEMEESLKVCQDIILLLGFWYYDGEKWWREGGHFVTMAGVHSEGAKVAFSDPDNDGAESGQRPGRVRPEVHPPHPGDPTVHNDPDYVSQDVYDCTINPEFPSPGSEKWNIDGYWTPRSKYSGINVPQRFAAYTRSVPKPADYVWHTEVEAAIMICPKPSNAVEGEEQGGLTPKDFELYQNYPNPFNNETVIKFNLRKSAEVTLVIYNVLGQKVRTLVKGRMDAGPQIVNWDGKDQKGNESSSGIYFYQLKVRRIHGTGEVTETKRLVLLK